LAVHLAAGLTALLHGSDGQMLSWPSKCEVSIQTLLILQRSQLRVHKTLTNAHVTAEMQQTFSTFIEPYLPIADRPRIVDIGPGLAMYHIYIARHYGGRSDHFLVDNNTQAHWDTSRKSLHKTGGWHKHGSKPLPFYGSQHCARAIAVSNGVSAEHWHPIDPTEEAVRALGRHSADLVMSLLSMGFHYPVSTYASAIHAVLKPHRGRLLLTLRSSESRQELVTLSDLGFACKTISPSTGEKKQTQTGLVVVALCTN